MRLHHLFEKDTLKLPDLEVGDEVKVGKFKNRKAEITGFDTDEHNQPVMKTTKGDHKVFKNRHSKLEEDYQWDDAEEGYDFENPLPIIDDADIWDEIEDLEADIKDDWEERTGKDWRETYGKVPGGYKRFWKEVSVVENVPINKIICTEKWLSKDHIQAILSGESRKDSLPLIHVVMGKYIATDGNHRIVAAELNGEKSIRCDVIHLPGTNESIDEASYEGNIGIMELIKFKQTAPPAIKKLLDYLIAAGRGKEAWKVVQQHTRTNLKGKQFK